MDFTVTAEFLHCDCKKSVDKNNEKTYKQRTEKGSALDHGKYLILSYRKPCPRYAEPKLRLKPFHYAPERGCGKGSKHIISGDTELSVEKGNKSRTDSLKKGKSQPCCYDQQNTCRI